MREAAINIQVQIFGKHICISLGQTHRSGSAGSCGRRMFNFVRNYQLFSKIDSLPTRHSKDSSGCTSY